METREVIARYYEFANKGDWSAWVDLFSPDQVMDEQLAGHVEGQHTLRQMMAEFPKMYSVFQNIPRHIVIEGNEAAVFSHISAETPGGDSVEADVANYFHVTSGRINYMSNVHDTLPFKALASK